MIGIKVADLMHAGRVSDRIDSALGRDFYATDWMTLNKNLFQWIKMEKIIMVVLLGMIILIAGFNIIGILTMMVGERGREVGILLAMGAARTQIQRIFVYNGLWYGGIGTGLGSLLGWLICVYLTEVGFGIPGDVYFIDRMPCIPQFMDFLVVAVSALALTWVATLVPSREASRLDPMDIIRYT